MARAGEGATEIHLVLLPKGRQGTVGGASRVAQLAAYDRATEDRLLLFDGEWVQGCVDPSVQKELDSLLAVLG